MEKIPQYFFSKKYIKAFQRLLFVLIKGKCVFFVGLMGIYLSLFHIAYAMRPDQYEQDREKKINTVGLTGTSPVVPPRDYQELRGTIPSLKDGEKASPLKYDPEDGSFFYESSAETSISVSSPHSHGKHNEKQKKEHHHNNNDSPQLHSQKTLAKEAFNSEQDPPPKKKKVKSPSLASKKKREKRREKAYFSTATVHKSDETQY